MQSGNQSGVIKNLILNGQMSLQTALNNASMTTTASSVEAKQTGEDKADVSQVVGSGVTQVVAGLPMSGEPEAEVAPASDVITRTEPATQPEPPSALV